MKNYILKWLRQAEADSVTAKHSFVIMQQHFGVSKLLKKR